MVFGKESGCGEGVRLFADSRIPIPDSLLGKRDTVRVGSAQLFSLERCDSPLSFPDWGIRLREIKIDRFNSSRFKLQDSGLRTQDLVMR